MTKDGGSQTSFQGKCPGKRVKLALSSRCQPHPISFGSRAQSPQVGRKPPETPAVAQTGVIYNYLNGRFPKQSQKRKRVQHF